MSIREGAGAIVRGLPFAIPTNPRWRAASAILLALALSVALTAILVFPTARTVQLKEGDVSPTDIRAPRKIQYESAVLTAQERAEAIRRVQSIYLPPDLRITRQAVKRASEVFETAEWVRGNPGATLDEKRAMLRGVPELRDLPTETLDLTLRASEEGWQRIKGETLRVVEQAMRQPIREDNLDEARRSLSNYISLNLSDAEAAAVAEYARRFIQPNSLLDEAATQLARRQAAANVPTTTRTIERGETILRAGDIVQPRHLEALEKLELLQDSLDWRSVVGTLLLVGLTVFTLGLYVVYRNPDFWVDGRRALLLVLVVLSFVLLAKLMVPGRTVLPYLFPGAAAAMLLTVLLEPRFALSTTLLLALMVSFLAGRSLDLLVYILLGGIVASLTLWRTERLMSFAWAGVYAILAQLICIASFRLIRAEYDVQGLIELGLAAIGSGILAVSLTTLGYYLLGNLFDLTTTLRLMELARPNQPLLRDLQLRAPGTYHHSLIVSNMAEEAAHRIGADALLCRVGAYYHDIGKLNNPHMFIENQLAGANPHDSLPPETSAQLIIGHVSEGLAMGREARLPRALLEHIAQHHGTTLVRFFYARAQELAGGAVDESQFRYPGPRPHTREAGILMLADCCEAAVRAKRPATTQDVSAIIGRVIDERLNEGQLDDSPLTRREIVRVRDAFENVLQGVYHPRVEYPTVQPAPPVENDVPLTMPAAVPDTRPARRARVIRFTERNR